MLSQHTNYYVCYDFLFTVAKEAGNMADECCDTKTQCLFLPEVHCTWYPCSKPTTQMTQVTPAFCCASSPDVSFLTLPYARGSELWAVTDGLQDALTLTVPTNVMLKGGCWIFGGSHTPCQWLPSSSLHMQPQLPDDRVPWSQEQHIWIHCTLDSLGDQLDTVWQDILL